MTSHSRSILVLSCEREGMQMLFDSKAFYRSEIMLSIHVQVRNEVGRHGDSHNCTSLFWFEWASWLVAPNFRHVRIVPSPHQHWYCCWARKGDSPQIESDVFIPLADAQGQDSVATSGCGRVVWFGLS